MVLLGLKDIDRALPYMWTSFENVSSANQYMKRVFFDVESGRRSFKFNRFPCFCYWKNVHTELGVRRLFSESEEKARSCKTVN